MTPDDYTTADLSDHARAEAEARWPQREADHYARQLAFVAGAEWARVYLPQQEPTDAEVEAAATAICSGENGCDPCFNWDESVKGGCTYCTRHARAALRAARDVRGQA
ncbi:hypothetical protein NLU66_16625 [Brachybacterium sp. NBEC-018]|uniref:hypothetical protein n=1 Tax=Brachybacterium sp. NBEC-018 TaxID=2996004 RepID=UPI0021753C43|nr:hypothetical protein [Brachybacterium sp. NBEC-018]UVY83813.1 hypothetical protein NLU66_16625 [Brachybacterium sp. NBEC-018]